MKKYFLPLGILLFAGVASQSAFADSFYLVQSNSTKVPCSLTSPCAEVTITTSGDTATFTVTSLDANYIFDNFGFNFTGPGSLSVDTNPASLAPSGEVGSYSLNTPPPSQLDGFGKFDYVFDTGESGGSNGGDCNPVGTAKCSFTFTLVDSNTSAVLTAAEFESLENGNSNSIFAGHLADPNNNTGFVGVASPTTSVTPEPSSLMLMGTGVLALAGVIRRRFSGR